jgi:hypothetical protein
LSGASQLQLIEFFYQPSENIHLIGFAVVRNLATSQQQELVMAKVICVLYDDPVTGYPKTYARDGLPKIERYPDGQTLPTPKGIDFTPGHLLGSVSGELGLRKYLESNGHTLIVTSSKDGANSVLDKESPKSSSLSPSGLRI